MTFVFNEERVQVLDTRLNSAADQLETLANEIATVADSNGLATPTPGLLTRIEDRYRRISVALNALRDGINNLDVNFLAELFDLPPQTVQVIIDDLEATGNLTFENVLAAIIDPARIDTVTDLIDPDQELDPGVAEALARIDDQLLDDLLDGTLNPDNLTDQQIADLRALAQVLSPNTPADEIAALSPAELVDFVQNAFNDLAEQRRRIFDARQQGQATLNEFQRLEDEGLSRSEIAAELGVREDELDFTIEFAGILASLEENPFPDPNAQSNDDLDFPDFPVPGQGSSADFFDRDNLPDLSDPEFRAFVTQLVVPLITGASNINDLADRIPDLEATAFVVDVLGGIAGVVETVSFAISDVLPTGFGGGTFQALGDAAGGFADFFAGTANALRGAADVLREILNPTPTNTNQGGGFEGKDPFAAPNDDTFQDTNNDGFDDGELSGGNDTDNPDIGGGLE